MAGRGERTKRKSGSRDVNAPFQLRQGVAPASKPAERLPYQRASTAQHEAAICRKTVSSHADLKLPCQGAPTKRSAPGGIQQHAGVAGVTFTRFDSETTGHIG